MLRRFTYLCGLMLAVLAVACSKPADKQLSKKQRRALEQQFVALRDTVNSRWQAMIADDDEKILYTKRLLQELALVPRIDPVRLKQIEAANEKLKNRRYQQMTLVSDSIDAYDNAQNMVLGQVLALAGQNPDPDRYHMVGELAQEIQAHDERVIKYRIAYDQAANAYNAWLAQHQGEVPAAASAKPVPTMALPQ